MFLNMSTNVKHSFSVNVFCFHSLFVNRKAALEFLTCLDSIQIGLFSVLQKQHFPLYYVMFLYNISYIKEIEACASDSKLLPVN